MKVFHLRGEEKGFQYLSYPCEGHLVLLCTSLPLGCVCLSVGLSHLCEFIEDCEHVDLATRILHLLGREGTKCSQPSKFIRFIYNRVLLETTPVRAGVCVCVCAHYYHE